MVIADPLIRRRWRIALGASAVAFILPNLSAPIWHYPAAIPPYIAQGAYRSLVAHEPTILPLPWGGKSEAMAWQAVRGFDFRLASGYTPTVPGRYLRQPFTKVLITAHRQPGDVAALRAFIAVNHVDLIVVSAATPHPWREIIATLRPTAVPIIRDGLMVYRVS
jgi:hypothetical protein